MRASTRSEALLIATAAVLDEASLITRNRRHVAKVPGLEVMEY